MIPDIRPTVDALAQRVGALATTLHRLDADVSGASLGSLDARIASLGTEPDTPERERRLSLLQRQRTRCTICSSGGSRWPISSRAPG